MRSHTMWDNYPTIQQDLNDVLLIIESNIKIRDKTIERIIKELIYAGGKLLRPAYFLLCSQIGPQYNRDQVLSIAAALEVLHMATLVHDDVIDDAPTRRGQETIQAKLGKNYAVYTGDYLFCLCFKILARHSKDLSNIEFNSSSVERILVGELNQMSMHYNTNIDIKQYLKQISGKTAQLFSLSCYLGAEISEASLYHKRISRRIGHNMGMAFQILDDILDYTQGTKCFGKPVLNDVKQGIYSLPLIYAMKKNREAFRTLLEKGNLLTEDDLSTILSLIHKYNGIQDAQDLATKYTNKALLLIEKLPEGSYREDMLLITGSLLNRDL